MSDRLGQMQVCFPQWIIRADMAIILGLVVVVGILVYGHINRK